MAEPGGTISFAYDYEGRALTRSFGGNVVESHSYNVFGARVGNVSSAGTKTFRRAGVGVTAPVLGDGQASYTPGVSERRAGVSTWSFGGSKSSALQWDSGANLTSARVYDAFGNLTNASGSW